MVKNWNFPEFAWCPYTLPREEKMKGSASHMFVFKVVDSTSLRYVKTREEKLDQRERRADVCMEVLMTLLWGDVPSVLYKHTLIYA